ncbi:hypothetical protein [Spiroplasma endosymbiont of Diplazon laetatorius]|uniref:hypothetical protein n=1 Tax=Spiroplasma endosymbiont of Diplazon laetatorius TaxID=3066322 RepID=UPI0030D5A0FB
MQDPKLFSEIKDTFESDMQANSVLKRVIGNRMILILDIIFGFLIGAGVIGVTIYSAISEANTKILLSAVGGLLAWIMFFGLSVKILHDRGKRLSTKLNHILHQNGKMQKLYESYFVSKNELKDIEDFKLISASPEVKIQKIWKWHKNYLAEKPLPVVKENINRLTFKYKGREAVYLINNPILFVENRDRWHRDGAIGFMMSNNRYGRKRTNTFKLSSDELFVVDDKLQKECNNLKIKKKGILKGDYRSESVAFNEKYSTNLASTDIAGAQFLTPVALDKLSNLDDKEFYRMGVGKNVFMEKVVLRKYIFPVGLFDFSRLKSKNQLIDFMCFKIDLEYDLLKRSLEYVSFLK